VLRRTLFYLSNQPRLFRYVRTSRLGRRIASRFVAGESLDDAVTAVRGLNDRHISASLDLLGESVASPEDARVATKAYVQLLDRIAAERLDANVSVKLTALGLDIATDLCVANVRQILTRARDVGNFVRLDMEGSAYTERTLTLFETCFHPEFPEQVGIVLQSYLYRTGEDVDRALQLKCRVRLCKGAYRESPAVAFPEKRDVDAAYLHCMERLLRAGNYPGIATHDERIIEDTIRLARSARISPDRFEFQMLYGVRRDLQERLVREGWGMRVYVPYGTRWYPYLMRRLAERPANVLFILGNLARERRGGRR
jgi:proline dehydrogenase